MSLFKDMLGSEESLFTNEVALDFDFVPKQLPYREQQQHYVAECIKPLLKGHSGRNLFVYGPPGIGKTAAVKWVFRDLEDETEDVVPIYMNCWQKNTTYKIALDICDQVGYRFTQNKKTDELFRIIAEMLNKKAAVFAFDEVDKLEDFDFLYTLMEKVYKRSILMITNHKEWLAMLDQRIKSRLSPDTLEFAPYNAKETTGILRERVSYAFVPNVWADEAFGLVSDRAYDQKDIRTGIYLLKQSGLAAEDRSSRKVEKQDTEAAISKLTDYTIKKSTDLEEDTRNILTIAKEHSGKKIGELYKIYKDKDGRNTYKTFQRKIDKLERNKFVTLKKLSGGAEGSTTIVNFAKEKKLTDF
jgi:cell division control protein 6